MKRSTDETPRSTSRRRILALTGAGLATALAGCGDQDNEEADFEEGTVDDLPDTGPPEPEEATAAEARAQQEGDEFAIELDALELREHEPVVEDDYRGLTIQGTVENTGDERVDSLEVHARVYDAEGNQLGRYLDSTHDLDGGATWSFTIVVLENPADVDAYDIAALGSME